MKTYGYVYLTKNLLNKKIYVGQKRGAFKTSYYGSGDSIKVAVKKYGRENFTVTLLCYCVSRELIDTTEIYFISKYRQLLGRENVYNKSIGGNTVMTGRNQSEKTKKRWKENKRNCGDKNGMYGVHLSGELNAMFGKKHLEATKKKIGEALSKIKGSMHGNYGKVRSEETREKISQSKKGNSPAPMAGKHHSEETRLKLSIVAKNRTDLVRNEKGRYSRSLKCA